MNPRTQAIQDTERSGVLIPSNLRRFEAEWVEPSEAARAAVDTYWAVRWQFPGDEAVTQRIVDFPAITLSIEDGDVPAPFMLTTVRPGAWSRVIRGHGTVFALRLRPAGLYVLSDLVPTSLGIEQALTRDLDPRAFDAMSTIAAADSTAERASRADRIIAEMIRERPIGRTHALANAAVDALTSSARVRSGKTVAAELGTSERTLQRALRSTIGLGPNDVARRIRLQEVVRVLSTPGADTVSTAAELGYADQAHLINEFRAVAGMTPGRYLRDLRSSLEGVSTTDGGT